MPTPSIPFVPFFPSTPSLPLAPLMPSAPFKPFAPSLPSTPFLPLVPFLPSLPLEPLTPSLPSEPIALPRFKTELSDNVISNSPSDEKEAVFMLALSCFDEASSADAHSFSVPE